MKKISKTISFTLCFVLLLAMNAISVFAANGDLSEGTYKVNILSLETKAPIPSVKKAFFTAFGEYAIVRVDADGSATAQMQNQHMKISDNDANVLSIKDAVVDSTKVEPFSNPKTKSQENVNCPDIFSITLNTDENHSQALTVTIDYMNQFLGGGDDFDTEVTLTLDFENAQKIDDSFSFTPANEVNEPSYDSTDTDSKNNSPMSAKTKTAICVIVAVLIGVLIVVLVIKKKNDDKYYKEYLARKKAKETSEKEEQSNDDK